MNFPYIYGSNTITTISKNYTLGYCYVRADKAKLSIVLSVCFAFSIERSEFKILLAI